MPLLLLPFANEIAERIVFRAQQQRQAEEEKMALITIHLTTGFQKGYAEEKRITRCRGDGDT